MAIRSRYWYNWEFSFCPGFQRWRMGVTCRGGGCLSVGGPLEVYVCACIPFFLFVSDDSEIFNEKGPQGPTVVSTWT